MTKWDKHYAEAAEKHTRLFGDRPCEVAREVLARSDFQARTALSLGDGDGRNGAWLATQGLAVTAIDISAVATEQARAHDRAMGVSVTRIAGDLETWSPRAGEAWDAVFMLYLHCESHVRLGALARAAGALPPGGWAVVEGFARSGLGRPGLGPDNADLRYDLPELLGALSGFRAIEALEGRVALDEGPRHQGAASIVRLLARKE